MFDYKSKCKWEKYTNFDKTKLTSNSAIFENIYHNGS